MPTTTTGLFFVARDYANRAAFSTHNDPDGTFILKVRVVDNQGPQRVEAYVVRWTGPQAKAFWDKHGPLKPGTALELELLNPRSFPGLRSPEIHATVKQCRLMPPRVASTTTTAAEAGALNHAS